MASQYPRSSQRDHSPDEAELITKEANDRRLRQAIIYLANHGDPDPYTEYRDRVDNINKFILGQYDTEGYSFDHKLYRRLRRMVKDQLREFRRADEEEAELFNGKGDDVEEINAPYRTNPREPSTASSSDYKLPDAIIRGTQRLYGGPRNEVEKWHKDFPPSLPFAGTFHMQEQERMKSNHDSKDNGIKNVHDSGSCFKLPHSQVKDMDKLFDVCQLQDAIDEFNIGNGRRELNKDYVPRIFLERIVPHSGPNNDFHDVICCKSRSPSCSALRLTIMQQTTDCLPIDAIHQLHSPTLKLDLNLWAALPLHSSNVHPLAYPPRGRHLSSTQFEPPELKPRTFAPSPRL